MKRNYESITILKGFACLIVFLAHWLAFFKTFGSPRIDSWVNEGPLFIVLYSSMSVSIFLMLSAALAGAGVYRKGCLQNLSAGIFKRYFSLCVPMFLTSMLVFLFQKTGLMFTESAGAALSNEFVQNMYVEDLNIIKLFSISFITAIFREENSFYVPFWMMSYIFIGSLLSMGLSVLMIDVKTWNRRAAVFVLLFIAMSVLDSYYLCTVLGNLLGFLMVEYEKSTANVESGYEMTEEVDTGNMQIKSITKTNDRKMHCTAILGGLALFAAGIICSHYAYKLAWNLGHKFELSAPLSDSWYWQVLSGFMIICGFILFYELSFGKRTKKKKPIRKLLLWIGNLSYEVFLTHWLVFCSFSCWFYLRCIDMHMHISILLNLGLSLGITFAASFVYKKLMQLIYSSFR